MRQAGYAIIIALIVLVAGSAHAASISYEPATVSVEVDPGKSISAPYMVRVINPAASMYQIRFATTISGTLPGFWITPATPYAQVSAKSPAASTQLIIQVPADTEPGTYTATVYSMVFSYNGPVPPGSGQILNVTVNRPATSCSDVPQFTDTAITPANLWAPNNKMINITLSGTISIPQGCAIDKTWSVVKDEYGEYSGDSSFDLTESGSFTLSVALKASRRGNDKDGRNYTIQLFARDEAGTGKSSTFSITVQHDSGKK